MMHRPTRHALAKENYIDIDMVNASFNIINEIMKQNEINIPHINEYCKNRKEYLQFIMNHYNIDKKKAKQLLLSLAFGGSYDKWIKENNYGDKEKIEYVENIEKDCKNVMEYIWKDNNFIIDDVIKSNEEKFDKYKKDANSTLNAKKRTCLSLFYQTIERHIQEGMIEFLVDEKNLNLDEIIPCQDGFMILKKYDYDGLIDDIQNVQLQKWGFVIPMEYKQFDEAIEISKEGVNNFEVKTNKIKYIENDLQAAEIVYKLYPHWVYCLEVLYVFNDDTGLWSSEKSDYHNIFRKFEKKLYIRPLAFEKKPSKSYGNTLCLMEKIPQLIKLFCKNDNWIKQKEASSLGYILFDNGYYDFRKKLFYHKEKYGFNPEIVFFGKIHRKFEEFDDEELEYIEDIKQRFFYNTLGEEVGNYFIETLARALAGEVQKKVLFNIGPTNTGKSVLTSGLNLSLGDYVGGFNAENLAYKKNENNDEAQSNRWALLLRYKRIILSNEIKTECNLNGNAIKKISSGGTDVLIGRMHNGNETPFTPHFLGIVFSNDLQKITPYDDAVDGRVKIISYTKQYVDEPTNDMELKKDENVKEEVKTEKFQKCLIGLLILQHLNFIENGPVDEPLQVKQAKIEWIGEDVTNGFINNFLRDFTLTNNEDDYVLSADIENWLKEGDYGITMKKFGVEFKRHLSKTSFDLVTNKSKRLEGKIKQIWSGIKIN